jgi:hypothetical protein
VVNIRVNPKLRKPFLVEKFSEYEISNFGRIWRDDSKWTLFRNFSLKSNDCKVCDSLRTNQCTGSYLLQNIDYDSINVNKDTLSQLKEQLQKNSEWYCYKKISVNDKKLKNSFI